MIRNRISLAIATALIATVALAGCKKKDEATTTAPMPATVAAPAPVEPAPAPMPASVVSVDLGNAVGADNKVTTASTTFAAKDTIHASVATDGSAGGKLNAKWTYQDGQTVDSQDKDVAAGPQTTDFSISKPDGWPAGKYKVEVSLDGAVVQSRDFEVK